MAYSWVQQPTETNENDGDKSRIEKKKEGYLWKAISELNDEKARKNIKISWILEYFRTIMDVCQF